MYKSYYSSFQSLLSIEDLPKFFTRDIDSTFFRLINPEGIALDEARSILSESVYNAMPMFNDFGLPGNIFTSEPQVTQDLVPFSPTLTGNSREFILTKDLEEFNNGFPTGINGSLIKQVEVGNPNSYSCSDPQYTNQTNCEADIDCHGEGAQCIWVNAGASPIVLDAHCIAPLKYKVSETDDTKTINTAYLLLHEGNWLSEGLLSIYDETFTYVESLSLSSISQVGSDLIQDEWIEPDDLVKACSDNAYADKSSCLETGNTWDNTYTLKYVYLVTDSLKIINPMELNADGTAPEIVNTSYTVTAEKWMDSTTDSGARSYITFTADTVTWDIEAEDGTIVNRVADPSKIQMIVEYEYAPAFILPAIGFTYNIHNIPSTHEPEKLPVTFSYLANAKYNTSPVITEGINSLTQTVHNQSTSLVPLFPSSTVIDSDNSTFQYRFSGHKAREGSTVLNMSLIHVHFQDSAQTNSSGNHTFTTSNDIQSIESWSVSFTNDEGNTIDISENYSLTYDDAALLLQLTVVDFCTDPQYNSQGTCEAAFEEWNNDWFTLNVNLKAYIIFEEFNFNTVERYKSTTTDLLKVTVESGSEDFYLTHPLSDDGSCIDISGNLVNAVLEEVCEEGGDYWKSSLSITFDGSCSDGQYYNQTDCESVNESWTEGEIQDYFNIVSDTANEMLINIEMGGHCSDNSGTFNSLDDCFQETGTCECGDESIGSCLGGNCNGDFLDEETCCLNQVNHYWTNSGVLGSTALLLEDTGDYATSNDQVLSTSNLTSGFTIGVWFKIPDNTAKYTIFEQGWGSPGGFHLGANMDIDGNYSAGELSFILTGDGSDDIKLSSLANLPGISINTNSWYRCVIWLFPGGFSAMVIDEVGVGDGITFADTQTTHDIIAISDVPMNVGSSSSVNKVTIDEIGIWDEDLGMNDIQETFGSGTPPDLTASSSYDNDVYINSLIHYWKFNENTGNTVQDEIGTNTLTLNSPTWTGTTCTAGPNPAWIAYTTKATCESAETGGWFGCDVESVVTDYATCNGFADFEGYHSSISSDDSTYWFPTYTWDATFNKGDILTTNYVGYTGTYTADNSIFYSTMLEGNFTIDPIETLIKYESILYNYQDTGTSLAWQNNYVEMPDGLFSKCLYSLDSGTSTIELFHPSGTLLDRKMLGKTPYTISNSADSTIEINSTILTPSFSPICIRFLENALFVLYRIAGWDLNDLYPENDRYVIAMHDPRTLDLIWSQALDDLIDPIVLTSFTFDREHNIILIGTKQEGDTSTIHAITYKLQYDYYYVHKIEETDDASGTDIFYFRDDHNDIILNHHTEGICSEAVQVSNEALGDFTEDTTGDDGQSAIFVLANTPSSAPVLSGAAAAAGFTSNWDGTTGFTVYPPAGWAASNLGISIACAVDYTHTIVGAEETEQVCCTANEGTWDATESICTDGIETWTPTTVVSTEEFPLMSRIVEYSLDQFGRVIGSDRWYGETGLNYLNRISNITTARGDVSTQKALDGISATLNADTYKITNNLIFNLQYPVYSGFCSTNEFYITEEGCEAVGETWTVPDITIVDSGDTSHTASEFVTIDGSLHDEDVPLASDKYNLINDTETGSGAGFLQLLDPSTLPDEFEIEIIYMSTEKNESLTDDDIDTHVVMTESFSGHRSTTLGGVTDKILLYDLLNSSYLENNYVTRTGIATGIYNHQIIEYIQKGGSIFKFKWGEFEWDNYKWADGNSIRTGLPTFYDGITSKMDASEDSFDQNFTSGISGDSLRYLGKDSIGRPQVSTGHFTYLDIGYHLYSALETIQISTDDYPLYPEAEVVPTQSSQWKEDYLGGYYTPLISFADSYCEGAKLDGTNISDPQPASEAVCEEAGLCDDPQYADKGTCQGNGEGWTDGVDGEWTTVSTYKQPGSGGPTILREAGVGDGLVVSAGDVILNNFFSYYTDSANISNGATWVTGYAPFEYNNVFSYEVYELRDLLGNNVFSVWRLLIKDTDYTINTNNGTIVNISGGTLKMRYVYNSSVPVLVVPTGDNIQIPYISKNTFTDTDNTNQVTTSVDIYTARQQVDLSTLTNVYSNTELNFINNSSTPWDEQTNQGSSTEQLTILRDPASPGERPWKEDWLSGTTDILIPNDGSIYNAYFDQSYSNVLTIDASSGPTLDYKHFNIGNKILAIGTTDGSRTLSKIEINASHSIINSGIIVSFFIKLLDEETGLIKGKKVKIESDDVVLQGDLISVTEEDGLALIEATISYTGSQAGETFTITATHGEDDSDEDWDTLTNSITLTYADSIA